jgi:hypothetical protein
MRLLVIAVIQGDDLRHPWDILSRDVQYRDGQYNRHVLLTPRRGIGNM